MFMSAHLSAHRRAIPSISLQRTASRIPPSTAAVNTLELLEQQLSGEFDTENRTELAIEMTQTLLDDHMFFFTSHLKMSMVSGGGVTGLTAHPCDYYEITVNLDKNK